mgnify:CR=1 FL=1|tara:strand:- start:767 stop:1015 length:249 start_codon:yes stop_codon:yes gene_type:complete
MSSGINIGFDHKDQKAGKVCMSCESPNVSAYDSQGFAICQECEESSACYCGALRGKDCECFKNCSICVADNNREIGHECSRQ